LVSRGCEASGFGWAFERGAGEASPVTLAFCSVQAPIVRPVDRENEQCRIRRLR
jgi:hypothetical protein